MKTWVVDYIDNSSDMIKLVDDNSQTITVPKMLFDQAVFEGAVIRINIDNEETDNRMKKATELINELFE